MRTHIGRHILLGECARDVCGYCGGHECTTPLLRNTQGRLVSVIVTNCPLEPTNVRYGAMACGSARNPCTNQPMQCVLCRDTVWLYGMAHHFDSKHAGFAPPSALCVKAEEKEMVGTGRERRTTASGLVMRWMLRMEGTPPPSPPPPQGASWPRGLRPTASWGGSWRPKPRGRPPGDALAPAPLILCAYPTTPLSCCFLSVGFFFCVACSLTFAHNAQTRGFHGDFDHVDIPLKCVEEGHPTVV